MDTWYIDNWQHLMGALDTVLDDARSNAAAIPGSHAVIRCTLIQGSEAALRGGGSTT